MAPAEDMLRGSQFGGQGGQGARDVAHSSSAMDQAAPAASTTCSCHLFPAASLWQQGWAEATGYKLL